MKLAPLCRRRDAAPPKPASIVRPPGLAALKSTGTHEAKLDIHRGSHLASPRPIGDDASVLILDELEYRALS